MANKDLKVDFSGLGSVSNVECNGNSWGFKLKFTTGTVSSSKACFSIYEYYKTIPSHSIILSDNAALMFKSGTEYSMQFVHLPKPFEYMD